jgi:hypothetical protein
LQQRSRVNTDKAKATESTERVNEQTNQDCFRGIIEGRVELNGIIDRLVGHLLVKDAIVGIETDEQDA